MSSSNQDGEQHQDVEPFLPVAPVDLMEHGIEDEDTLEDVLTGSQAWCLYTSHFLSLWNSRSYEFAAILFIQNAFPGDLLPSSINGIAETICVLLSSPTLGRWVDGASSRLRPLLLTIITGRASLVACCILWLFLYNSPSDTIKKVVFTAILLLGMGEKASRMTNTLSMERDWVPTLANLDVRDYGLTHLNTTMRRIDIACKFVGPLATSGLVSLVGPASASVVLAGVSSASLGLECWAVMRVWKQSVRLRAIKKSSNNTKVGLESNPPNRSDPGATPLNGPFLRALIVRGEKVAKRAHGMIEAPFDSLCYYFSTTAWLPSVCVAALHGSVLAWSGTLITWLLNANFSLGEITVAKGIGSGFEIGSTVVFPWAVGVCSTAWPEDPTTTSYQMIEQNNLDGYLHATDQDPQLASNKLDEDSRNDKYFLNNRNLHFSVIKVARWGICGLLLCLIPTMIALFGLNNHITYASQEIDAPAVSPMTTSRIYALTFLLFLSLSFLGRWTYDLAITQLTQMLIPAARRSSFGGTEQAIVSCVSLVHWVAAATWHREEDFIWLALGSFCAVAAATGAFVWWTRWWLKDTKNTVNATRI